MSRIVEVLYSFESTNDRGYAVSVHPGERYFLLADKDPDWWYVSKDETSVDAGFYIPRTYVTFVTAVQKIVTLR